MCKIFKLNLRITEQPLPAEDELEDELLADENVTPIERVYAFRENDSLINR
jgi:hypothetical protein